MRAGATTVPMLTQQQYLARLAGGAGVAWKAEGQPITESTPTFERVTLTAKTLPVLVRLSQSSSLRICPSRRRRPSSGR
jgi:HK97 family phage major capsid protein